MNVDVDDGGGGGSGDVGALGWSPPLRVTHAGTNKHQENTYFNSIATSLSMSGITLLFEVYTSNNTCEEVGPKGGAPTSKSDGQVLRRA